MATSLTTLKARVASELHRTDLTSDIATAISSAILEYRSQRFEFNQAQSAFNTVANTQSYTTGDTGFPTDIAQIDYVRATVNSQYVAVEPTTYEEIRALTTSTSVTGSPIKWAWYALKLWLYPIPDAVYSVQLSYLQRKAAPSSDGDDTSVWTNEAGDLICANAKKRVARHVMFDDELAKRCEIEETSAFAVLAGESGQLQNTGSGLAPNW